MPSTADSVGESLRIVNELTGGKRVPILFDSRDWPRGDPASWVRFISMIEAVCLAAGVVANPESVRAMGRFPDFLDDLVIPFKIFEDEEDALSFLRRQI